MSFDADFNYGNATTYLSDGQDSLDSMIAKTEGDISMLANITMPHVDEKITALEERKTLYNVGKTMYNELQGYVDDIEALEPSDKTILHDFYYGYVEPSEPKDMWMTRMLKNAVTGNLLLDVEMVVNGNLTSEEANLMTELVCENYPITGNIVELQFVM